MRGHSIVDPTDIRTGGNEIAESHSERRSRRYDMPSIRPLKKAGSKAAAAYHL